MAQAKCNAPKPPEAPDGSRRLPEADSATIPRSARPPGRWPGARPGRCWVFRRIAQWSGPLTRRSPSAVPICSGERIYIHR